MGFVRRKVYELRFGPAELEGLVVRMRPCDIDTMLEVRTLLLPDRVVPREQAAAEMLRAVEIVAQHLVDWNLENEAQDGTQTPVPATDDGVRAQDRALLAEILGAWQDAVEGVAAPLPQPSPSGGTSVVESIPMEILSESLAS